MSYDISLWVDTGGPDWGEVAGTAVNYTGNVATMWRAAGADLAAFDRKIAGDCLEQLRQAIAEMGAHPEKYEAMNPANGWGDAQGARAFLQALAAIWAEHLRAIVVVDR